MVLLFCGECILIVSIQEPGFVILILLYIVFQAEDGIRDLVRSRGLGDVYKRQVFAVYECDRYFAQVKAQTPGGKFHFYLKRIADKSVSYTHLTLPTSDLV